MPFHFHAREFDGHEPSVSAPPADGWNQDNSTGDPPRRELDRGRLHVFASVRETTSRREIHPGEKGTTQGTRPHDGANGLSVPDAEVSNRRKRTSGAGPVERVCPER